MAIPLNYIGEYANGGYYSLGQVVSTMAGNPYGIAGAYWTRTGNPGNPGYPPSYDGTPNESWTLYVFPKTIEGPGSITGPGSIN